MEQTMRTLRIFPSVGLTLRQRRKTCRQGRTSEGRNRASATSSSRCSRGVTEASTGDLLPTAVPRNPGRADAVQTADSGSCCTHQPLETNCRRRRTSGKERDVLCRYVAKKISACERTLGKEQHRLRRLQHRDASEVRWINLSDARATPPRTFLSGRYRPLSTMVGQTIPN